jgi:alpha-1,2-mannosyltransferase
MSRRTWVAVAAGVAVAAFALRLVPVLRGGGLWGLLGYDGGVYYTAAAGLAHGLLPYRDFLLLHPPGIALALLPFALLGRLIGDADAMALARLAWMGLGAVSAALVVMVLRRFGPVAALAGGLFYAVYVPAIFVERTTALEALTGVCTAGAVLLLVRAFDRPATAGRLAVLAGALLGFSSATKIWGVAVLVAVLVWCAVSLGRRRAVQLAAGAAAALVLVCLPFFLAAPVTMWRMVVGAQLGRLRVPVPVRTKLVDAAGLTEVHVRHQSALLVAVGLAAVLVVAVALRSREGRLASVLLAVGLGLLVASPAWSPDYASLLAVPLALLLGTAVGVLLGRSRPWVSVCAGAVVVGVLAGYTALSAPTTTFGPGFPGRSLGRLLAGTPGCVTTDDPTALVEADLLRRNLARGCPLMADLGGYSYYLQPGASLQVGRARNEQWQRFTLDYLGSGEATVVVRFRDTVGLSGPTRATIAGWPVIGLAGPWEVRHPTR